MKFNCGLTPLKKRWMRIAFPIAMDEIDTEIRFHYTVIRRLEKFRVELREHEMQNRENPGTHTTQQKEKQP